MAPKKDMLKFQLQDFHIQKNALFFFFKYLNVSEKTVIREAKIINLRIVLPKIFV